MDETLTLSALALGVLALLPAAKRRIELSRAKHRSLAGHSRMAKRLARLHPPYLVSIAVVIVFGWLMMLVPAFHAKPPDTSWQSLLAHFFYLNDFIGRP